MISEKPFLKGFVSPVGVSVILINFFFSTTTFFLPSELRDFLFSDGSLSNCTFQFSGFLMSGESKLPLNILHFLLSYYRKILEVLYKTF